MNRVTRMVIGLVTLVPVLGLAGALLQVVGVEGEAGAWVALGVGLVWIALAIMWTLRAPDQLSEEAKGRYLAFLKHARFRPLDPPDSDTK